MSSTTINIVLEFLRSILPLSSLRDLSFSTQDLGLAQTVANASGTVTPLGSLALQIYRLMTQSGYSGKDFSSVFKFLEEKQH